MFKLKLKASAEFSAACTIVQFKQTPAPCHGDLSIMDQSWLSIPSDLPNLIFETYYTSSQFQKIMIFVYSMI